MIPYWLLYLLPAGLTLARVPITPRVGGFLALVLVAAIGLRYEVGGDWVAYIGYLLRAEQLTLLEIVVQQDPGYYLVNWLSASFGFQVWFVNVVCAALFVGGLLAFVRRLPDPMLALTAAMPYLVTVVAMGYTRQAVALGLALFALVALADRSTGRFLLWIAAAVTFHKSAVLLVPLAVLAGSRDRLTTIVAVAATTGVLFVLFLADHTDHLWHHYVESDYAMAAQGGVIRVAMNAVPAVLLILWLRRFPMSQDQRTLWFAVAVLALVCVPLVFQAPTAVDRIALYLIPLQLVVAGYLPALVVPEQRAAIRFAVVAYSAAVLFVWLNFANHAFVWLPYRFWLFE